MEKFKKVLIKRIIFLIIFALCAVALGVFHTFFAPVEIISSKVFAFQCGIISALGIMALYLIIQYTKALRNETALKILYNKENDERMKTIKAKAGVPILLVTSILMIAASLIVSYFSLTAFYALFAAAICQMLIACAVKFVYMKIM